MIPPQEEKGKQRFLKDKQCHRPENHQQTRVQLEPYEKSEEEQSRKIPEKIMAENSLTLQIQEAQ